MGNLIIRSTIRLTASGCLVLLVSASALAQTPGSATRGARGVRLYRPFQFFLPEGTTRRPPSGPEADLLRLFEQKVNTLRSRISALPQAPQVIAKARSSLLDCLAQVQRNGRSVIVDASFARTLSGTAIESQELPEIVSRQLVAQQERQPRQICRSSQARLAVVLSQLFGDLPSGIPVPSSTGPTLSPAERELVQRLEQTRGEQALASAATSAPQAALSAEPSEPEMRPATTAVTIEPTVPTLQQIQERFPVRERPSNPTLTLEEARDLFPGFQIGYRGSPRFEANLYGRLFQNCRAAFIVRNSAQDRTLLGRDSENSPYSGFEIRDETGSGRECIRQTRGNITTQCEANEFLANHKRNPRYCVSLQTIDGARADFRSVPSSRVGLLVLNPNSDVAPISGMATDSIQHLSATDDQARAQEDRRAQIERLAANSRCRGSESNLLRASTAVRRLARMNRAEVRAIIPGFDPARLLQEIERSRLDLLASRVARANEDQLAEIREELIAYLDNHPEDANRVRSIYERVANRYLAVAGENREKGLANARSAIEELAGTGAFEGAAQNRLTNVAWELQVAQLQHSAQTGSTNPFGLWRSWQDLYQRSYENYFNSCFGGSIGGLGGDASLEGCMNSAQRVQTLSAIPSIAQQTQMRRYQIQQQMQQQIATALYGNMGGGAWAGGAFGNMGGNPGIPGAGPSLVPNLPALPLTSQAGTLPGINL